MKCTYCLMKHTEIVELVKGVCPKCGTDYFVLADVFSVPVKKEPKKKTPRK